jgi:hypothetical protein
VESRKKGDNAQCCGIFVGVAAAEDLPRSPGVSGARGGEWSALCVSSFAWDLADTVAEELARRMGVHGEKWRLSVGNSERD